MWVTLCPEEGIGTDPEKIEVVKHWKEPTDLKSLRSFLRFCEEVENASHRFHKVIPQGV